MIGFFNWLTALGFHWNFKVGSSHAASQARVILAGCGPLHLRNPPASVEKKKGTAFEIGFERWPSNGKRGGWLSLLEHLLGSASYKRRGRLTEPQIESILCYLIWISWYLVRLCFYRPSLIDAEDGISPCSTPSSSSWERCSFTEGKWAQQSRLRNRYILNRCTHAILQRALTQAVQQLPCFVFFYPLHSEQSSFPLHPNVKHELIDMVGALPVSAGIRADNLMLSIDKHCLDLFKNHWKHLLEVGEKRFTCSATAAWMYVFKYHQCSPLGVFLCQHFLF